MKTHICFLSLFIFHIFLFIDVTASKKPVKISSPDNDILIEVSTKKSLRYRVLYQNNELISWSQVGLELKNANDIAKNGMPEISIKKSLQQKIKPVLPTKHADSTYVYNQLMLTYPGNNGIIFRVYNDGLAYRFFTNFNDSVSILNEIANFTLAKDWMLYRPGYETFHSSQEELYRYEKISSLESDSLCYAPILVETGNGVKMLITESALTDYAGLWLSRNKYKETTLTGRFPAYPKKEKQTKDRTIIVTETEKYIAKTSGKRNYPWRVIGIFENDKQIIESDLVFRLGPELAIKDPSWIKPGKVAWDWWNANNIYNVDFEAGINTATYKYYIDFASENNLEYIILDEGWSDTKDLFKISPEIDLPELVRYGREKNVGIILWVVWCTVAQQMDEALPAFEKWGIKGIKVDFMDRDDQKMVQFYHKLAKSCANHHLLLNMHAAYKPTGIKKAYPNFLTREGVLGQEFNKWSEKPNPEYAVTIPFIRMFAGPLDYTPGAMNNANENNFRSIFTRPMSKGTRAHQIAMYIIFESPLQMLCDAPTAYKKNPGCTEFIANTPVTWEQTICLDANVSDYVVVAREKNDIWYLGAITDWTPREINLDFSFLPPGNYNAEIISDGPNSHRNARDHKHVKKTISNQSDLIIKLAPGGGWAARLVAVN